MMENRAIELLKIIEDAVNELKCYADATAINQEENNRMHAISKDVKYERITVRRAAELTGMSELTIRIGIDNGELDFGRCIHTGTKRTNYHISPALLAKYLGMTVEQVKGEEI